MLDFTWVCTKNWESLEVQSPSFGGSKLRKQPGLTGTAGIDSAQTKDDATATRPVETTIKVQTKRTSLKIKVSGRES